MTHIRSAFAKCVRHLRGQAGLSQEELAGAAGMDRAFLGQLERGERSARLETVEKLARALRVEPRELLDHCPPAPRERTPAEAFGARVAALAHGATEEQLALFERLARTFFEAEPPRRRRR